MPQAIISGFRPFTKRFYRYYWLVSGVNGTICAKTFLFERCLLSVMHLVTATWFVAALSEVFTAKFEKICPAKHPQLVKMATISSHEMRTPRLFFADDNPDIDMKHYPEKVCFEKLGCFTDEIAGTVPTAPANINPFYSFNELNKFPVNVSWNASETKLSEIAAHLFDRERSLVIVAHGFGESLRKQWPWDLSEALLIAYKGDAVTMLIDWSRGSYLPLYARAASNVQLVAKMTVKLVQRLMAAFPTIKANNIHFVGFSLGGQMSGYFARQFFNATGERIGHVTALDTAAPHFEHLGIMPKRGDADFVEAIHTSASGNILTGKVGIIEPYGDIDFYPNGGVKQPGCSIIQLACSHKRAFVLYTHALLEADHCQMKGKRCQNVSEANEGKCNGTDIDAYIGMLRSPTLKKQDDDFHIVYFKTNGQVPFCS
ncbi:lipase member H-A-like [Tropilaelaps mercedesae]|uniref:Lipase member H-A-like n=1 Tax=Tropilaelaps mercedesae TaxID=418985 RepID=A0A1V9XP98_9ACAR|nr:lipase member H-A-like [Tropilaelaps mercedesae]